MFTIMSDRLRRKSAIGDHINSIVDKHCNRTFGDMRSTIIRMMWYICPRYVSFLRVDQWLPLKSADAWLS